MYSRNANTQRKPKRRRSGPCIEDMIVVKTYDQMDSLRELLESNPRKDDMTNGLDDEDVLKRVEEAEKADVARGMQRKRNEEEIDFEGMGSPTEQASKRRRIIVDADNDTSPMELLAAESLFPTVDGVRGKENIAPGMEVTRVIDATHM